MSRPPPSGEEPSPLNTSYLASATAIKLPFSNVEMAGMRKWSLFAVLGGKGPPFVTCSLLAGMLPAFKRDSFFVSAEAERGNSGIIERNSVPAVAMLMPRFQSFEVAVLFLLISASCK